MTFCDLVNVQFPNKNSVCCKGKRALSNSDKAKVVCEKPWEILYSFDLDACAKKQYPRENRWDYGVSIGKDDEERVIWIEVHAASTNEVSCVLKKRDWLREWLSTKAPKLYNITGNSLNRSNCFWIASNGIHIPRHTRQYKQLQQEGLFPRKALLLPENGSSSQKKKNS